MQYEFPQFIWEWKDWDVSVAEKFLPGQSAIMAFQNEKRTSGHFAAISWTLDGVPVILDAQATDVCELTGGDTAAAIGKIQVNKYAEGLGFKHFSILNSSPTKETLEDTKEHSSELHIQPEWKRDAVAFTTFDIAPDTVACDRAKTAAEGRYYGQSKTLWTDTIKYRKEFMLRAIDFCEKQVEAAKLHLVLVLKLHP